MANTKKTTSAKQTTSNTQDKAVVKKPKKVSLDEMVDVQSCVMGKLVWRSPKTGYKIIWNEFGSTNPMLVSDLLDMRNGTRKFFERNWVTILGDRADAIVDYLQVARYYKDNITPDELDSIILGDQNDVYSVVSNFNPTMKETTAYRAAQLYKDGELDSAKTIAAIKKATGIEICS